MHFFPHVNEESPWFLFGDRDPMDLALPNWKAGYVAKKGFSFYSGSGAAWAPSSQAFPCAPRLGGSKRAGRFVVLPRWVSGVWLYLQPGPGWLRKDGTTFTSPTCGLGLALFLPVIFISLRLLSVWWFGLRLCRAERLSSLYLLFLLFSVICRKFLQWSRVFPVPYLWPCRHLQQAAPSA